MKIPTIHSSNVKAYVLFTTISVLFIATTFVLSFYTTLYSKELRINYKIAETQALFNAETGVAETAYPFLVKSSFVLGIYQNHLRTCVTQVPRETYHYQ